MSQYWLQIASGPDVTFHRDTPGPPYTPTRPLVAPGRNIVIPLGVAAYT
jgi:hypothetical protein